MNQIRRYRRTPTDKCSIEGCDREHIARGLCRKHYNAYRRSGEFKRAETQPAECVVPWCEKSTLARGLCYTHYNKWNQRKRRGTASESAAELGARGRYKCKECGRPLIEHSVLEPCA